MTVRFGNNRLAFYREQLYRRLEGNILIRYQSLPGPSRRPSAIWLVQHDVRAPARVDITIILINILTG